MNVKTISLSLAVGLASLSTGHARENSCPLVADSTACGVVGGVLYQYTSTGPLLNAMDLQASAQPGLRAASRAQERLRGALFGALRGSRGINDGACSSNNRLNTRRAPPICFLRREGQ